MFWTASDWVVADACANASRSYKTQCSFVCPMCCPAQLCIQHYKSCTECHLCWALRSVTAFHPLLACHYSDSLWPEQEAGGDVVSPSCSLSIFKLLSHPSDVNHYLAAGTQLGWRTYKCTESSGIIFGCDSNHSLILFEV